jgi:predicted ATPase
VAHALTWGMPLSQLCRDRARLKAQAEAAFELAAAQGEPGAALATVAEALDWARTSGEAWIEAELLRVKGELLLGGSANDTEDAERCFQKALESARAREARGWELRSAVSLARLRADQGRRDEARQLLDPVYAWFEEGFDTPDLTEAEALLRELA